MGGFHAHARTQASTFLTYAHTMHAHAHAHAHAHKLSRECYNTIKKHIIFLFGFISSDYCSLYYEQDQK